MPTPKEILKFLKKIGVHGTPADIVKKGKIFIISLAEGGFVTYKPQN